MKYESHVAKSIASEMKKAIHLKLLGVLSEANFRTIRSVLLEQYKEIYPQRSSRPRLNFGEEKFK